MRGVMKMSELYTEKFSAKSFSIIKGIFYRDFPGHTHAANCYELHYILDGRGELITDDGTFHLRKNAVYVTGPNLYHMQKTYSDNPMCEYCIFFETLEQTKDIFLNIFFSQNFWIGRSSRKIKKLFDDIYLLHNKGTLYHSRQAALLMQMLLFELAGIYQPQITRLPNRTDISVINDVIVTESFFLFNLKNLTLGSLSDALGMSERQTQRMLIKNYGRSFRKKKKEAQLEHSKMMLRDENCPLSRIAEECGFCSDAAFCNFFKKQTGMTPVSYRNEKSGK